MMSREGMNFASQRAVVLVVDKYSQDVHLASLTAGVKYPVKYISQEGKIAYTKEFYSILADLANIQPGVRVFFYRRRIDEPPEGRGFIGEWEADGSPYEDLVREIAYGNLKILGRCPKCECPVSRLPDKKSQNKSYSQPHCKSCKTELEGHILPLRFPLKLFHPYQRYLDDNTAYVDITDEGRLSTLIFRKVYGAGRERSVNPILPEEAEKLRRLLLRVESEKRNNLVSSPDELNPCEPLEMPNKYLNFKGEEELTFYSNKGNFIKKKFPYDEDKDQMLFETVLEFWIMQQLNNNQKKILSVLDTSHNEYLEWFANQVLFGIGGEKSDVLLLMRNAEGLRCRAIVIELKKGDIDSKSLEQVKSYAYWVAQLVTAQVQNAIQRPFEITPIAIGRRVKQNAQTFEGFRFEIPYTPPLTVIVNPPRVFTYSVDNANNTLQLSRVI